VTKIDPAKLKGGSTVWIPCEAKGGMFPSECYVKFDVTGEITITVVGFIPREDIKEIDGAGARVRAVVARASEKFSSIIFRGEILSSTNPVTVPTVWLTANAVAA